MRVKRALALVAAVALVLSLAAPALTASVAAQSGMVGVSDSQITQDVPDGESIPVTASDLEGSVLVSSGHADSLEVIATTPEHASTVMNSDANVVGSGEMALVFRDSSDHSTREIAVDAGLLREALGYKPEVVYGTHSSGETWQSQATYEDGYLSMQIQSWSSNTVTFSGSVDISASPASDGSSFTYQLGEVDSTSDPVVNITGRESTEQDTDSGTLANGETLSLTPAGTEAATDVSVTFTGSGFGERRDDYSASSVGLSHTASIGVEGALQPTDGSGGDPSLSVTANAVLASQYNPIDVQGDGTRDYSAILAGDTGSDSTQSSDLKVVPQTTGDVDSLSVNIAGIDGSDRPAPIDVYMISEGPDGDTTEGTLVKDNWQPSWSTGSKSITLDTPYRVSSGSTYSVAFHMTASDNDGTREKLKIANTDSTSGTWYYGVGGSSRATDITLDIKETPQNVQVTDGAGHSATFGDFVPGETKTRSIDLRSGSTELDISASGGGTLDYQLTMLERDATVDPSIDIDSDGSTDASYSGMLANGESATASLSALPLSTSSATIGTASQSAPVSTAVSYTEHTLPSDVGAVLNGESVNVSGPLSDGEQVSRTFNSSVLQEGSNTLTIDIGDGSLSSDAPAPQIGLGFQHSATDQINVTYQARAFEERYNISRTYADATSDATVTIPFESSSVIGVANVEYRVNGGDWSPVPPSHYRFESTTLDVHVADAYEAQIPSGATVDVRAAGRKIDVSNGEVTITDPSKPGEELDTQLQINSRQSGFHINVGPTANGPRIHYATSSLYPTSDYSVIEADGDQKVYLPDSETGDTFRMQYLQTQAIPEKGDVKIRVKKAGSNPELAISPGPMGGGDPVTYRYYRTTSGVKYLLESLTNKLVRASDIANSPAILEDDDSDELLAIVADGDTSTDSDSGGGGFFSNPGSVVPQMSSPSLSVPGWLPIAGISVLGLGAVVAVGSRVYGSRNSSSSTSTSGGSTGRFGSIARGGAGVAAIVLRGSGRVVAWIARYGGRGALAGIRLLNRALIRVMSNTYAAVLLAIGGFLLAGQLGLVPRRAITLGTVIALLVGTLYGLQRLGLYSHRLFLLVGGLFSIGAVELLSPGLLQQFTGQLPLALLAILGTILIIGWFFFVRRPEASTPETVNRILFRDGGGGNN